MKTNTLTINIPLVVPDELLEDFKKEHSREAQIELLTDNILFDVVASFKEESGRCTIREVAKKILEAESK